MSISNLYIDQGSDYSTTITIKDSNGSIIDLTDHTVISQIRKTYSSGTSTVFNTTVDVPSTSGKLTLSLTNVQTLNIIAGIYVYDVVILNTTSGIKSRVSEGSIVISPGVSR